MNDPIKNSNSLVDHAEPRKSNRGLKILFGVLIFWTVLIAIGTFQTQASTDIRRPLIVVATMGLFLGVWAIALLMRKRS